MAKKKQLTVMNTVAMVVLMIVVIGVIMIINSMGWFFSTQEIELIFMLIVFMGAGVLILQM